MKNTFKDMRKYTKCILWLFVIECNLDEAGDLDRYGKLIFIKQSLSLLATFGVIGI